MRHSNGFTLIEVILIIIISAISTTILISYTSTYMRSPVSAILVSNQYKLIQAMEELTSNYRQALPTDGSTLDLCAFETNYIDGKLQIDGKNIVDAANTSCTYKLKDSTNTYETNNVLLVTLVYGDQRLQTIFTN